MCKLAKGLSKRSAMAKGCQKVAEFAKKKLTKKMIKNVPKKPKMVYKGTCNSKKN